MMVKIKNKILLSTYVISMLPSLFYGTSTRMWLSIFHGRPKTTRLDFVVLYYTIAVNFLILAYCLHYNKGISKKITKLILIIAVLDFIHLFFFAKQGFGIAKIGLALSIYFYNDVKNYVKRLIWYNFKT